ncbi:MAG TPA: TetR family transcriptional regulator [Enteractinococcus helveticum]|uniref:TetR family transcriptional regulator n=1 Tax=Enteractinococcus helveticum TaxID=1837282 RepID=A0A921K6C2_9MICC|nr:TetR family transcriptional regulator [Enteractinococcus helveticum]HJF13283.1 TetR family transcriptional regulator [Enteractinococcus helveticum]
MTEHAQGLGRREQKKRETRRAIRDAALDLALENGLENLTVEAIAQAAGVSPRTVFNYFDSKEDALVTQAAEGADEVCKLLLERPSQEPPLEAFRHAVIHSDYFGADPVNRERVLARQRLTQNHPSLMAHHLGKIAMVERMFADALAERLGLDAQDDIAPQLLAAVAMSAIRVAVRQWVCKDELPLYDLFETTFKQLEHLGLVTQHPQPAD